MFIPVKRIATIVLALSLVTSPALADSDAMQQLVNNASYWLDQGRPDKAAEVWRKILRSEPTHTEALTQLALYEARQGRADLARAYLIRLKKIRPSDSAIASIEHAIEVGEGFEPSLSKARRLAQQGYRAEAIQMYEMAFGSKEPPLDVALEYYQTLGGLKTGWQGARKGLEDLVRRFPGSTRYRLALATHLTYRNETRQEGIRRLQALASDPSVGKQALAAWRQALLWMPGGGGTATALENYLAVVPGDDDIQKRLTQLRAGSTDANYLDDAFQALDQQDVRKAESLLERQRAYSGRSPEVLVGLAMVALQKQDFPKAREILLEVKELVPDRPEMWERSLKSAEFWNMMEEGRDATDVRVAREKFRKAREISEDESFHADIEIANTYIAEGNDVMAEVSVRNALTLDPTNPVAMRMLVDLLLRTNRGDAARKLNGELATINVDYAYDVDSLEAEVLRGKANLSREAGDLEAARNLLVQATQRDPENVLALMDLAYVHLELGSTKAAREVVDAVIEDDPLFIDAHVASARIFEREKKTAAALGVLEALSQADLPPDVVKLRDRLKVERETSDAVRQFFAERPMDARHRLTQIQRRVEEDIDLLSVVALGWAEIGDHDRAVALLRDALLRSPDNDPSIRLQLASVLLKAGKEPEFLATVRELREEPELSYWERTGLAELRVAHGVTRTDQLREGGNLNEAFAFLSPLLQEYPNDPKLLCALGRIFYSAESYPRAETAFGRVLKDDRDNLEALEGYVLTSIKLKAERKGRQLIEAALERSPRNARLLLLAGRFRALTGDRKKATDALLSAQSIAGRVDERDLLDGARAMFGEDSGAPSESYSLQGEIANELRKIRSQDRVAMHASPVLRRRDGRDGLDGLTIFKMPITLGIPSRMGELGLSVTMVNASAGTLNPSQDITVFGSYGLTTLTAPEPMPVLDAGGFAMAAHYRLGGLSLEIGSTPMGFANETLVGSVQLRQKFQGLGVSIQAFRQPVEDSVLSYAGIEDPLTGIVWGSVLSHGGRLDIGYEDQAFTYYLFGDYQVLLGQSVPENRAAGGGLGARWTLYDFDDSVVQAGLNVSGKSYQRNLRYFTTGHGGYFSPQMLLHVGIPFHFNGRRDRLTWRASLEAGTNWFNEDAAPYYPQHPDLQIALQQTGETATYPAQSSTGFAFDGALDVSYEIRSGLRLGARTQIHSAKDYQELVGQAFLELDFLRRVQQRTGGLDIPK